MLVVRLCCGVDYLSARMFLSQRNCNVFMLMQMFNPMRMRIFLANIQTTACCSVCVRIRYHIVRLASALHKLVKVSRRMHNYESVSCVFPYCQNDPTAIRYESLHTLPHHLAEFIERMAPVCVFVVVPYFCAVLCATFQTYL